eukprot:3617095-Rhodomonas_salina.1
MHSTAQHRPRQRQALRDTSLREVEREGGREEGRVRGRERACKRMRGREEREKGQGKRCAAGQSDSHAGSGIRRTRPGAQASVWTLPRPSYGTERPSIIC